MDVRTPAVAYGQRNAEPVSRNSRETAGAGDREERGAAERGEEQRERGVEAGRTTAGPGRALSSAARMRRARSAMERGDVPFRRQGNRRIRTDRCDRLGERGSWCDGEICILSLDMSTDPKTEWTWGYDRPQEDGACSRDRMKWARLRHVNTERHGRQ